MLKIPTLNQVIKATPKEELAYVIDVPPIPKQYWELRRRNFVVLTTLSKLSFAIQSMLNLYPSRACEHLYMDIHTGKILAVVSEYINEEITEDNKSLAYAEDYLEVERNYNKFGVVPSHIYI